MNNNKTTHSTPHNVDMVLLKQETENVVNFIKQYFEQNSFAKGAILGMSGGKDSLIVAKLCILALGADRVFGVIMPNGTMLDKNDAVKTCELLGIKYANVDISNAYNAIIETTNTVLNQNNTQLTSVSTINTAPRVRMATLYAIGGSMNYLVANTSNLSETMVGYTTKWGDNVGDFAPIANFTKTEVCLMGEILGLPHELVFKEPSDGLSGSSDEEKMQLKYNNLDSYIRTGENNLDRAQILKLHSHSHHKRNGATKYQNNLPNVFYKQN